MPDITGALTAKLGPAPVWMWLAGGGIGLWLLTRSGALSGILPGSSSTGTSAQTAAGQATAAEAGAQQAAAAATGVSPGAALSQEVGLLQQLQQFQQQSYQNNLQQVQQTQQTTQALTPPAPAPSRLIAGSSNPGLGSSHSIPLYQPGSQTLQTSAGPKQVGMQTVSQIQFGQQLTQSGQPITSTWYDPSGNAVGDVFIPVTTPSGVNGYVSAADIAQGQGGAGRGGPSIPPRLHAGGRPTLGAAHSVFRPGHPFLKLGDVTYPASRKGGPRSVIAAAAQAGVHPARILAVNHHAQAGQVAQGDRMHVA